MQHKWQILIGMSEIWSWKYHTFGFPNLVLKYIIVIVIYFLLDKLTMNIYL